MGQAQPKTIKTMASCDGGRRKEELGVTDTAVFAGGCFWGVELSFSGSRGAEHTRWIHRWARFETNV